ncbi:multicopper oxidase domain-containing protein [Neobacillus rhizophilus]|uniref:multicopper oxidase domain-containing protein n=1 Tax=Neobacillus rhizophilus TaxID=2833579 RepID=UPI0027DDE39E|nr:multicopper oxidase domain-containing protein [Neobacillus rhizophilus]
MDNSFKGDGTPGVSQKEVEDGETYTYEFVAGHSGTYFYHCHVEPDRYSAVESKEGWKILDSFN